MWPEYKDMNLLQGQVLWGKKREAEECYKSIMFMFFIFPKVKLHPNEVTEKNVKVAKTSTQIRKSQIKFAYASLFQLPCVLIVTQSSVTQLGFVCLFWFGFFVSECFVTPPALHPATRPLPQSVHRIDDTLKMKGCTESKLFMPCLLQHLGAV